MNFQQFKDFIQTCAIRLSKGSHHSPKTGMCVMECVAYIAGERHTDKPMCACPVISQFAISLNDVAHEHQRQRLLPFIMRLANSNVHSGKIKGQRAKFLRDVGASRAMAKLAQNYYAHLADFFLVRPSTSQLEEEEIFNFLLHCLDSVLLIGEQAPFEEAPLQDVTKQKLHELEAITTVREPHHAQVS